MDDSLEDERDLDMADRRATEIELDTMEGFASREKLHHHLNDQGWLGFLFFFFSVFSFSPSPVENSLWYVLVLSPASHFLRLIVSGNRF